jgi:hypothetical protein
VANSESSPAQVHVSTFGTGAPVSSFTVAPGGLVVLNSNQVGGLQAYEVTSTRPVSVEEDDSPAAAPGIVSFAGVPFSS